MLKLTESELDVWAKAWHDYLEVVLERRRRAKSERQAAFELQSGLNAAAAERMRMERWGRERAMQAAKRGFR